MANHRERGIPQIAVSEFKAKCLSLLEEVNKTKTTLRITRRGKPIAEVIPASNETEAKDWIGSMSGCTKIVGDVISPVIGFRKIEALKK